MALIAGSPCYPRVGVLTQSWRSYTQTWRSFASPASIASVAASSGAGGWMATAPLPSVSVAVHPPATVSGWPLRLCADSLAVNIGLPVSSQAAISAAAGCGALVSVLGACSGLLSMNASALFVSSLAGDASPGVLRSVVAPWARLTRGRSLWPI